MKSNLPFDVSVFENIDMPFGGTINDSSCFQLLINRFGVYVVQERQTGKILYVGEAHAQDLKERITQNYTLRDTGGTFRDNWIEAEGQDFEGFKAILSNCTIKTVSIDIKSKKIIKHMESLLISALDPKYNKLK